MGLASFFRRFMGEDDVALSTLEGLRFAADSGGLNVFLPRDQYLALQQGKGNALQKVQLIALHMLAEQGAAEAIANGFRIDAETVAAMDDEQAEIFRLPRRYPGRFVANIIGRTGSSGFQVTLAAQMAEGPLPFQRKGPYLLLTSSEQYRLTPAELYGLNALEHHQGLSADERGEAANVRLMAELQTAARSGMQVDLSHFDRMDVVVPEGVGVIATRLPDGSLELCPTLGDGSSAEQLGKRWSQLDMSANGGVLRIDNRVVLLDEAQMNGVRNVLSSRRIPADKVAEFIATPTAFLDAALVNLDMGFSLRVAGIGKPQHVDFGELDLVRNDWFALDRRPAAPSIISKVVQSPEELERLKELIVAAQGQGAESVHFGGHAIDITNIELVAHEVAAAETRLADPDFQKANAPALHTTEQDEKQGEKVAVVLKEADAISSGLLHKAQSAELNHEPDWSAYAREPFPHQREGIEWMLKLLNVALQDDHLDLYRLQGALLADDMGLGKTYMALVAVGEYLKSQRRQQKPEKPVLVVAPLSLLENWEDEVSKTYPAVPFRDVIVLQSGRDLSQFRVKGAERESAQLAALGENELAEEQSIRYALTIGPEAGAHRLDMDRRLVLTTYQTLRDYQFSLCQIDWGMVIFDEAQNIKNPNAHQTRAAKGLKADFKLLATGTPVENSLGDFWCLMDTAQPGLLGGWDHFRDTWIKPILAADDEVRDQVRVEVGNDLRRAVGIFMLRRIKEDQLKGLPSKTICTGLQVDGGGMSHNTMLAAMMRGAQLEAYDGVLNEYRNRRDAEEDLRGIALAALSNLRSISLHPRLENETALYARSAAQARGYMQESGKLEVLLSVLDGIQAKGEKVILFMVTKRLQRLLKLWLDQIYGLDIAVINGDTKAVATKEETMTRKKLIVEFEARKGFNVLIMSPVAAGVGLTVVGANHVVHLERHWNPAKEAQASDRVYRIGQTKPVFIHLPVVTHPQYDSFDVHLDRLLRGKLMLKDAVITPDAVAEKDVIKSMGL